MVEHVSFHILILLVKISY